MPGPWDVALIVLFAAAWPIYSHFVEWPRHVRLVAGGDPQARRRIYTRAIAQQWALSAAVVVLFVAFARPFEALGLTLPTGWRLAVGLGIPAAYAALMALQIPAVARNDATRARLRGRMAHLAPLLPHTAAEWARFVALAVTAGICEELLFRGYLVWALTPWLGVLGAAATSAVVFGLAHSYQGGKSGGGAFVVGAMIGALALSLGSILPGMILHAAIDLGSGYIGYLAMRDPAPAEETATATVA